MDETSTNLDDVSTAAEFDELIGQLVRSAYENGVNFEGGWEIRNRAEVPDWEVLIHELAKQDGD